MPDLNHIELSQWDLHVRPDAPPVSTEAPYSITFFTSGAHQVRLSKGTQRVMGEQQAFNEADKKSNDQLDKDVSEKLRESLSGSNAFLLAEAKNTNSAKPNSDKTLEYIAQSRAGRYGIVTTEALLDIPNGIANGVKHNWDNPGEFAVKMGTAAAFGVGMNLLLPKAGAVKAIVGGAMTYFMVKDAAAPVINAYKTVHADGTDLKTIHGAAKEMSNGLGLFAVDMVAGLPVGIAADKLTGMALESTKAGRNFIEWKENFYNGKTSTLGKFSNQTDELANSIAEKIRGKETKPSMEDVLSGAQKDKAPMSIEQKLELIKKELSHEHGVPSSLRPDAEKAFEAALQHKRWHKNEMPNKIDILLGENAAKADGLIARSDRKGALPEIPEHIGDKLKAVGEVPPAGPGDKVSGAVQQMAVTMREAAAKVTETDMKIANFRESVQSPLEQSMRTKMPPPLDEGHWANNRNLIELTQQITKPEHVQQAGMLLEHHRVANVQMGIPDKLPEIVVLNQYSRSVHQDMINMLKKANINPDQVLRGTNSPIFLIFDSQGAGPYTIPAIKGVTDTAVVVLPREYQKMLGVHVAGVYRHELGHDLVYGDLLRFPESLRDNVLKKDVIANVMKAKNIGDTPVDIPGHGSMPKSEFFRQLLLAEANENTADIFASSRDPNSGLSLATLLSSLRKPQEGAPAGTAGKLETRSMYGKEFANAENPLGIEVHGIDAWRIKLSAEVLRQLSKNDPKVNAYADKMVNLADNMRRPGDNYVWASMDDPGKFVSIPIKEWDAIIPGIVKAQLETPLPALNNKALRDTYGNMAEIFPKIDSLADKMAAAARNGDKTVPGFDKGAQRIEDVFSAGLSGWMKAMESNPEPGVAGHIKPEKLLRRINDLSTELTMQYAGDNYVTPSTLNPNVTPNINTFSMPSIAKFAGNTMNSVRSNVIDTRPVQTLGKGIGWTVKNAVRPEISGPYMGLHYAKEFTDAMEQRNKK